MRIVCVRIQVDALVQLGLRASVSPAVLMDAARALDSCKPADKDARDRAHALLTQLEVVAFEEAQGKPTRCTGLHAVVLVAG